MIRSAVMRRTRHHLGMSISALHPDEGPLARGGYLVMAFDTRTGHLAVHGDLSYAESSFDDAVADAQDATAVAAAQRLPIQYAVIRMERVAAYRPI
jgi:hypothetical protein